MKTALATIAALTLVAIFACNVAGSWLATSALGHGPASTDGRYHECGLVTEDGVTEHIAAYRARCGDK